MIEPDSQRHRSDRRHATDSSGAGSLRFEAVMVTVLVVVSTGAFLKGIYDIIRSLVR